ncbi:alcohol dehydrogenase-like 7 isoform X1 [Capsicum annuum]|uniref:alcohol dehydrogenase-like 7 isoform X1 n=1 Tax=Capsicum annuum TaxID=4072 RepID=UPI0007BED479|nr:alcohol dehydrogenase-like 7 isoform X1 [Capsicum annuum]XP_016549743.1 alcohol dehydrogenase-like 7 isoform X1 [Capsicum annuum]XP_016549749.1 alcohol dehydrogenase-like 7 isoform X1 [Capsicum annuum]XP_047265617.1 alcohol dehydrogenase-like 7 isoform X1 [Capsicum annuum]XP_047265621.1 alcohol dehydrogenase-like 7 isoform X1 [Capsicum annuum]
MVHLRMRGLFIRFLASPLSRRGRAAIARKPGEPLVIEEVIVAPPKVHEVRLKIICTSLCHSDVTFWKLKDFPGCFPRILGHEASVEAIVMRNLIQSMQEDFEDKLWDR